MNDVYTAPEADLTGKNTLLDEPLPPEYVGFWFRVLASSVDSILIMVITVPVLFMVYGASYYDSAELTQGPLDIVLNYLVPFGLTIAFWMYKLATPGKMAIHAKIVDANTGEKPSTMQFVVRYIGYFLSLIPLGLGFLWVGWDARKQGWHDKIAGTVVVRSRG